VTATGTAMADCHQGVKNEGMKNEKELNEILNDEFLKLLDGEFRCNGGSTACRPDGGAAEELVLLIE
jgi:hypothetical protein